MDGEDKKVLALARKYTDSQLIEAGNVTGVKGDAEETYRAGKVNITPNNIGSYSKDETDNLLNAKVDDVEGKGLSTEDYTTTEKTKLSGISTGATKTESSTTNGKIKIDGTETVVYDDSEIKQDLSTDTATVTGNPLNFTTLTAQKAKETEISLEPIQDLHGYDHPWPGGGWKNKLDQSQMENSTNLKSVTITLKPNTQYTASTNATNTQVIAVFKETGGTNQQLDSTHSPTVTTTENGQVTIQYRIASESIDIQDYNWQIEEGSTATNYAPYSNYCPIDGRTETSLVGCGKNLVEGKIESSHYLSITSNGTIVQSYQDAVHMYYAKVLKGQTYTATTGGILVFGFFYDKPIEDSVSYNNARTVSNDTTFVAPISGYVAFRVEVTYETPQLELGSRATTYEPYTPSNNLTIQFGEKVYGGTVDLESGTVTVEWGYIAEYNGETLSGEWISDRDVYAPNTSPSTGAEVVYELATPITYHLTPHQVSLLEGVNTIWTDGTSIKVTYRDGKVATLADLQDTANNLQEQIDQNETMEDETTQLLYKLGVNNGLLFMEEV